MQAGAPEDRSFSVWLDKNTPRAVMLDSGCTFVELKLTVAAHALGFGESTTRVALANHHEAEPHNADASRQEEIAVFVQQCTANCDDEAISSSSSSSSTEASWSSEKSSVGANDSSKPTREEGEAKQGWLDVGYFVLANFTDAAGLSRSLSSKLSSTSTDLMDGDASALLAANKTWSSYNKNAQHRLLVRTSSNSAFVAKLEVNTMNDYGVAQTYLGLVVLVAAYVLIALEVVERTLVALVAMLVALLLCAVGHKRFSLEDIAAWLDQPTFVLLFGMMVIVKIFGETGFFEWVSVRAIKLSRGSVRLLFVLINMPTAIFSAFLDSVTTVLLSAPITLKACEAMEISPIPFLMAQALLGNIAGAATMIGDPPNMIIGSLLREHVDFLSFIVNCGPMALLGLALAVCYFLFWWRHTVNGTRKIDLETMLRDTEIRQKRKLTLSSIILALVLLFFFLSSVLEVEPAWIALAGAVALMLVTYPKHLDVPLSGVEWDMLVFFAALFVLINSMNSLGIIDLISSAIAAAVRPVADDKQLYVAMTIVLWFAAVMSAFLSSIPTTTMLIPVIQQMAANPQLSLPLRPLIWALSLGSCFGGNGTLIGAPSSLVVAGVVRSKGYFITFASFSKVSALITTALVVLSNIYLILIYGVLGWGH